MSVLRILSSRTQTAATTERTTMARADQEPSPFEAAFRERLPTNRREARDAKPSSVASTKKSKADDRKTTSVATQCEQQSVLQPLPPIVPMQADQAAAAGRPAADDVARDLVATRAIETIGSFTAAAPATQDAATPTLSAMADLGKPGVFDDVLAQMQPVDHGAEQATQSSLSSGESAVESSAAPVSAAHAAITTHAPENEGVQTVDPAPTATRPPVRDDAVLEIIAQQTSPKAAAPESEREERMPRVDDYARIGKSSEPGLPMQLLRSDAPAPVEAIKEVKDVDWHGLADRLVNVGAGSIEGHRARLVIGSGDERVVMTISTHAHRVSVEVEQNTPAGTAMAEALRNGQHELREALGRHGLDLAQQGSRDMPEQEHVPERRDRRSVEQAKSTQSSNETSTTNDSKRVVVVA